MAAVFDRYPAGGGEFVLALALADNAHDDGTHIFPSVPSMAAKSRQSERQVQRCLTAMLASGWLIKVRNAAGRGRPAEYRINPAWLAGKGDILTPFSNEQELSTNPDKMSPFCAQKTGKKGDIRDGKRVTFETEKGDICDIPIRTGSNHIPPYPPVGGADTSVDNSGGFEDFFAAYPRRVGKGQARHEWDRLAPDASLRKRIADAIAAWARSPEWQRNGGQYIPKPARWLREQRWEDEPGCALAPPPVRPTPTLVSAVPLTPEQLKANAEKARAVREAWGLAAPKRRTRSAACAEGVAA